MLQVDSFRCFYMFFWPWHALSAAAYYKESETWPKWTSLPCYCNYSYSGSSLTCNKLRSYNGMLMASYMSFKLKVLRMGNTKVWPPLAWAPFIIGLNSCNQGVMYLITKSYPRESLQAGANHEKKIRWTQTLSQMWQTLLVFHCTLFVSALWLSFVTKSG